MFDLICTGTNGERFLIEIQRGKQGRFKERALFYAARTISDSAPKGNRADWAYDIDEVYLIALLEDFTLEDSDPDEYLHDICLCDRETGKIFYEKLGFIYIELSKFVKTGSELETGLDQWLHALKHLHTMRQLPAFLRSPIFEKLFNIAEYSNLTKEEKNMYDSSLKYKWDNKNVLDYKVKETEKKTQEKIASEMIKEGMPYAQISKFTGLSIEEIEKL